MQRTVIHLMIAGIVVLLAGCAARTPVNNPNNAVDSASTASKTPKKRIKMEPFKLKAVAGTVGPEIQVMDAADLFDRGGKLLSAKKYAEAVAAYDKLLKNFPTSSLVSSALYNAGLAYEELGQFDKAANRYKELIRRFGGQKSAVDAGFRLGGCYAELRNWPASARVFEVILSRSDLSPADRVEALARKGLAHFRLGDERTCRSTLMEAVRYNASLPVTDQLDADFFLGMANYYLAAIPHVSFRKMKVSAGKNMGKELDEKAHHLLLSQTAYIRTIKVKNPYWATAAGFQIGSLYREFYTLLLTTLPDFSRQAKQNARKAKISEDKARKQLVQVYLEEVHKAVKPLLSKAIRVFEKNVLVAERVGIESNWVGKSRHQVNELKHLLSVPPEEAVKLVDKETLPEDQPALNVRDPDLSDDDAPTGTAPTEDPAAAPKVPNTDQPGTIIM